MKRSDLIKNLVARQPDIPARDVTESVTLLFDCMSSALVAGRRCEIRGFGVFSVHVQKARIGRNPRTGALVPIPEKGVPHFKPGKLLIETVMLSQAVTAIQE